MIKKILAWVFYPQNRKEGRPVTVIKVRSWRPFWGDYGLEWPCMLVQRNGRRETASPVIMSHVKYYFNEGFKK